MKESYQARGINPDRLAAVLEHAGKQVLDVGCGSGAYVTRLRDRYEIRGVDFQRFDTWAEAPGLFAVSDAAKLSQADASVDTVLSFETLEHLPDAMPALREYHRVCRKNLILTVPNCAISDGMKASNLLYSHWSDPTHRAFYDEASISALIRQAGFTIRKISTINEINPIPFVLELFAVPRFLRGALSLVLRHFCIKRHRMTLLVVAEKGSHAN